MWLFTLDGFFSAVEHKDNPELIMVRARVREDLERMLERLPRDPGRDEVTIWSWTGTDYAFRVFIPRDLWTAYVELSAHQIDYTNFKAAVGAAGLTEGGRLAVYHDIWARLVQWQDRARSWFSGGHGGGGPEEPAWGRSVSELTWRDQDLDLVWEDLEEEDDPW